MRLWQASQNPRFYWKKTCRQVIQFFSKVVSFYEEKVAENIGVGLKFIIVLPKNLLKLFKLVKYEFKSSIKLYIPIWTTLYFY
jgi:hypothetical protein